jgi:hypothetical protein
MDISTRRWPWSTPAGSRCACCPTATCHEAAVRSGAQDQRNAEIGGKLKAEGESSTPRRRTPAAGRIDEAFKAADKNNDGKLSRDEYPQPGVFDAVDANKDGFATQEEVRAYFRDRRGN